MCHRRRAMKEHTIDPETGIRPTKEWEHTAGADWFGMLGLVRPGHQGQTAGSSAASPLTCRLPALLLANDAAQSQLALRGTEPDHSVCRRQCRSLVKKKQNSPDARF